MRFSVGVWALGKTADRFVLSGYKRDVSFERKIAIAANVEGIEGVECTYPTDFRYEEIDKIKDGAKVSVDAEKGIVRIE